MEDIGYYHTHQNISPSRHHNYHPNSNTKYVKKYLSEFFITILFSFISMTQIRIWHYVHINMVNINLAWSRLHRKPVSLLSLIQDNSQNMLDRNHTFFLQFCHSSFFLAYIFHTLWPNDKHWQKWQPYQIVLFILSKHTFLLLFFHA